MDQDQIQDKLQQTREEVVEIKADQKMLTDRQDRIEDRVIKNEKSTKWLFWTVIAVYVTEQLPTEKLAIILDKAPSIVGLFLKAHGG